MKNSKIHELLDKKDLRDFFSMLMVKNYEQEFANKKEIISYRPKEENIFEWAIKDAEHEITFQQKKIQLLKEKQAIIQLIKMQGWDEFDVSDETEKDLDYILKMNFIGTGSEYSTLLKTLEKDK